MTTIHTKADNGEGPAAASAREAILVADEIEASDRLWLRFARDACTIAAAREYDRGRGDGYAQAIADVKAHQHGLVADEQLEQLRWHVCCPPCRLNGHPHDRSGRRLHCPDCQARSRETFGLPIPGEPDIAGIRAGARASREPLGLGPPGMVHLGGPPVHGHAPCTRACYAYRPGWYPVADAIRIIRTLPGSHDEALAELRAWAAAPGSEAA